MRSNRFFAKKTNSGDNKRKIFLVAIMSLSISCLAVSAQSPESTRIDLSLINATLKELFIAIEEASNFRFLYDAKDVNTDVPVTAKYKNTSIDRILREKLTDYVCEIKGNQIVVRSKRIAAVTSAQAPAKRITGVVVDSSDEPIPGAAVRVKGTTEGTATDTNGNFTFNNVPADAILQISFIGYKTQEISIYDQTNLNIKLLEDSQALDEVVVVGYSTQKKINLTGAVSGIKGGDIVKAQSSNTMTTLAGNLSGLIVKQYQGSPGSGAEIHIRGVATYRGGTSPAFIIDGVERTSADFERLDPHEIESLNILKDAASAAVFGMRGANGVILVTTRRGVEGKTKISYTGDYSIQNPTQLPQFANSAEFATGLNKYMGREVYTDAEIRKFADGSDPENYPDTDWYAMMFKQNVMQYSHNVNITGGTESLKYFATVNYINQQGMWERCKYNRLSARLNVDAKITSSTQLSVDVSYRREVDKGGGSNSGVFGDLGRNTPVMLAQYLNGLWHDPDPQHVNILAYQDPKLASYTNPQNNTLLSKVELMQDLSFLTQGLKVKGIYSYDKGLSYSKNWSVSPYLYERSSQDPNVYDLLPRSSPTLSMSMDDREYTEYQGHVTYDRIFGDHAVSGLLMTLAHQTFNKSVSARRNDFESEAMDQMNAGNLTGQTLSGADSKSARLSYIGRINYAYLSKYLFEANFRRDASENFHPDYRWGTFASVSAGWILSEESFWTRLKDKINFLKIRTSHGTLGNDNTGGIAYPYYNRYDLSGQYYFGSDVIKGLSPGVLPNEMATWETSTKTNFAIDGGLFNKVSFSFDYFYELRSDILVQRNLAIPATIGATLPLENIGKVENQGVEAVAGFNHRINDVRFSISGNFTYAWNRILEIAEAENTSKFLKRTGRPIHTYYGYATDGIFKSQAEIDSYAKQEVAGASYETQPGDIRYVDVDGDNKVDANDRTSLGYGNVPNIIYGINGNVEWKGFNLNFLFQGAEQVQLHLTGGVIMPYYNDGNLPKMWVTDGYDNNPDSRFPRLSNTTHNFPISNVVQTYLFDASYLRLKNIELSYNLPKKWLETMRLYGLRLYVSGQNLLTFTGLDLVDPEINNTAGWQYPVMKSYNAGINIQF
jgi:TonB-linked SusC/RagA family outer membrane protein